MQAGRKKEAFSFKFRPNPRRMGKSREKKSSGNNKRDNTNEHIYRGNGFSLRFLFPGAMLQKGKFTALQEGIFGGREGGYHADFVLFQN